MVGDESSKKVKKILIKCKTCKEIYYLVLEIFRSF